MPRTLSLHPNWSLRLEAHDRVATESTLAGLGFTPRAVQHRVATSAWQRLLPGIYCCHSGTPTRRQLVVAALLWAGDESCIDAADACHFYGLPSPAFDPGRVRVVVPFTSPARTSRFVVVRRTKRPIRMVRTPLARYLCPADALIAAASSLTSTDAAVALLSEALRRGTVDVAALKDAYRTTSPHGNRRATEALEAVAGGVRSAPEADVRAMLLASPRLPQPLFNPRLRLPGGRIVVPDALIVESAVVHEVNGRAWHAAEDRFDSMQERHDTMTAAGLVLLHNSPRRIEADPRQVLAEIEETHARYAGRGLPPGVTLLPADASESHVADLRIADRRRSNVRDPRSGPGKPGARATGRRGQTSDSRQASTRSA